MRRRAQKACKRFLKSADGATMVEMAVVLPLTLLIVFALYDFGRMAFTYVKAQKAVHNATRIAIVRPPVCTGVPNTHSANTVLTPPPRYGTYCSSGGACATPTPAIVTCTGNGSATATEIWSRVNQLLPPGSTIANLQFSYAYDPNLGFVGGPYTPMVTVDTTGLNFNFILPIGQLGSFITGGASTFNSNPTFPNMSVSMPGEDLNHGVAG